MLKQYGRFFPSKKPKIRLRLIGPRTLNLRYDKTEITKTNGIPAKHQRAGE